MDMTQELKGINRYAHRLGLFAPETYYDRNGVEKTMFPSYLKELFFTITRNTRCVEHRDYVAPEFTPEEEKIIRNARRALKTIVRCCEAHVKSYEGFPNKGVYRVNNDWLTAIGYVITFLGKIHNFEGGEINGIDPAAEGDAGRSTETD